MAGAVQPAEDDGLEVGTLFVSRAFNAFQARVQGKRIVTFRSPDGAAGLSLAGAEGVWTSPVTGAFGGVAAAGPAPAGAVSEIVERATDWLRGEARATRATVRLPPDVFPDPNAGALENALFQAGWRLAQVDLNQHLAVTAPEAFAAALGETKQKELRRLRRSGATFVTRPAPEAEAVYQAIARNRAARGFPMTMGWTQVAALAEAFPDRVGFHAVERAGATLAGAVVLRITDRYRYVFYWGEDPDVRRESPVVLLAEGLVALCHRDGVAILDIGTSTEASKPNPGLIAFKESLGCRASAKRTWVLEI